MADLKKTVDIIFYGEDRVSQAVKAIGKSMNTFEAGVQGIADPLSKVTEGVLAADAALGAMVAGGMALAIRESGRFGDSFNEISTLIDASAADIDTLRAGILEYAQSSGQSIDSINAAVYSAISAGTDYRDSLALLGDAEKLAVAGKADLNDSIVLLASTMNAFGASTDEAQRYSDVFFQTVKLGQVTLPEIAASLSQVTGLAASGGVDIESLSAALAALTASGTPTSQAVTAIKAALSNIIKPSSQAASTAEALGVQFNATALESKGFEGVIRDVFDATGGSTEQMAKLFGSTDALNSVMVLGADRLGKFREGLAAMSSATGSVDQAFARMAENFELTNQQIANTVTTTLIKAGDRLQGGYGDMAGGIVDVLKEVGDAIDAGTFDPFFSAIDDFADKAQAFLAAVAKNLPDALGEIDFDGVLDALGELGDEVASFFDGIDLTSAEGLAAALQQAVNTIESLVRVTSGIAEYMHPVFDAIAEGVERFNSLDDASQKAAGNVLGAAELIVTAGVKIGAALVIIQESGASIESVFNVVIGSVKTVWNSFQVTFDLVVLRVSQALLTLTTAAEKVTFGDLKRSLKESSAELETWIKGVKAVTLNDAQQTLAGMSQAWDGLTGKTRGATDQVKAFKVETDGLSTDIDTNITITADSLDAQEVQRLLDEQIPTDREVTVSSIADARSLATAEAALLAAAPDEAAPDEKDVLVKPAVDPLAVSNMAEQVDEALRDSIERAKISAELAEATLQFKAEVDVAALEAEAKKVQAIFGGIETSIQSTGEVISNLFGTLAGGDLWGSDKWALLDQLKAEENRRQQSFELEKELTEKQIELMDAKRDALDRGDGAITISMDGVEPELEMIMWKIIERVQIRANETNAEFLLGI